MSLLSCGPLPLCSQVILLDVIKARVSMEGGLFCWISANARREECSLKICGRYHFLWNSTSMNSPLMLSSLLSTDSSEMSDQLIIFLMLLFRSCFIRPSDSPLILTSLGSFTDFGWTAGPDNLSDRFFCNCGVLMLLKTGERVGSSSSMISNTFGSVLSPGLAQLLEMCFLRVLGYSLRWWFILFLLRSSCRQCLQFFQLSMLLFRLKQSSSYLDLYLWKALPSTSSRFSDLYFSPSMMQFCSSISTSNSSSFSSTVSRLDRRTDISLMRSFRYTSTSRLEQDDLLCNFSKILLNCRYFSSRPRKSQQICSSSSALASSSSRAISVSCVCRYEVFCSQLRSLRSCNLRLLDSMAAPSCSISPRSCSMRLWRLLTLPASTCSSLISSSMMVSSFCRSAFSPWQISMCSSTVWMEIFNFLLSLANLSSSAWNSSCSSWQQRRQASSSSTVMFIFLALPTSSSSPASMRFHSASIPQISFIMSNRYSPLTARFFFTSARSLSAAGRGGCGESPREGACLCTLILQVSYIRWMHDQRRNDFQGSMDIVERFCYHCFVEVTREDEKKGEYSLIQKY